MHRLAATPEVFDPQTEGVVFIEQTPADIIVLTAADTDIQMLAAAVSSLGDNFPSLRAANLLYLQQQLSIDTYAEDVLSHGKAIVLRVLGGRSYWSYGLEVVKETVAETGASLWVLPGDDRPDLELTSHSTVPLAAVDRLWQYFIEGGVENIANAMKFVARSSLKFDCHYSLPMAVSRLGVLPNWDAFASDNNAGKVAILFYRAHYLAGNTAAVEALCEALRDRGLQPLAIFVSSLRDRDIQEELASNLNDVDLVLNTTGFAMNAIDDRTDKDSNSPFPNVPIFQVIFSSSSEASWKQQTLGLSPRDMAMNVALPEVDGRIITRAISFKSERSWHDKLETSVVVYKPRRDRVSFVADLAENWIKLRTTPRQQRKIALVLANYPNKDGRLANGVGLDTPASCIEILKALKTAGYVVENIPASGDELIDRLTAGTTNDREQFSLRSPNQTLPVSEYNTFFSQLPEAVRKGIGNRWNDDGSPSEDFPISGIQLGNIFVGIQPSRGYDRDPSLNYHAPDLEPTPDYLAFYCWLREQFQADAIVHIGKHGNLEWLPGKSIALSSECYPEVAFGSVPHFYPFIVNDPGEGSQAKRRSQAVILDHLTPPMTRAELYGNLQQLEGLIDEYYEARDLDPTRLTAIGDRILDLVRREQLQPELVSNKKEKIDTCLASIDGYLCELKEAQIRDGLHIFGCCPQGEQLRDLIIAIARHPSRDRVGLTRAIAKDLGLNFDPLTTNFSTELDGGNFNISGSPLAPLNKGGTTEDEFASKIEFLPPILKWRTVGDAVEAIENYAKQIVNDLIDNLLPIHYPLTTTQIELDWICDRLLPRLLQTDAEINNLLRGLEGEFVPSGASGAPTRGRWDVLPTGRNFYSVDIRSIPTETAWMVGKKAAETLIERYVQENGEYPQSLGLSVWGTSTMRTGGDDIAQALYLIGVQPIWDGASRRVIDLEILSPSVLKRPRVDVTLRISGFFRDGFPNLIELFDRAVRAVSDLDEPANINPIADRVRQEADRWQKMGLDFETAKARSRYRIFGSKPGAYGAGLQGLIEAQNWEDDRDLATAYLNWSSYAYTIASEGNFSIRGQSAPEAFQSRLEQMQIVLHNQDNREHDLLDSDDYYQFQGGLVAAVRSLRGENPTTYFGDNSMPENPKVRSLSEEIEKVYRSRVVNPKWIAGVMRHGYKGAFEMAATVDYLFAYDATTRCVKDFMYEGVANAYLFDDKVRDFIQQKNSWALRDMAERLLEAHQRRLWNNASVDDIEKLRAIVHEAEEKVETRG